MKDEALLDPVTAVSASGPAYVFWFIEQLAAAGTALGLEPELVLDPTSEELEFGADRVLAPHWLRCIAPNQDFHRFAGQPNGTLLFRAPCAFVPVPERLRELGWNATVLATSSDGAWRGTPFADERALSTLTRDEAHALPKQALLVDLVHDEPGRGELVFAGAATPSRSATTGRKGA